MRISKTFYCLILTFLTSIELRASFNEDTLRRIEVDNFPITNEMLENTELDKTLRDIKSGEIHSYDKAWFKNAILNEYVVIELYTDYHRLESYHFSGDLIPKDIIKSIVLHYQPSDVVNETAKLKNFNGFLNQSTEIEKIYFTTNKGIQLGNEKSDVIKILGQPDRIEIVDNLEKISWNFIGDQLIDERRSNYEKPFALDSFGYSHIMYFENDRLIGQIIKHNIP